MHSSGPLSPMLKLQKKPKKDMSGIADLPEVCISHVLSFTSPADVYRFAATARMFTWVLNDDYLWGSFLPIDHKEEILERAVKPISVASYTSKKDLYLSLCKPLLIDGGNKSIALERTTGKKCIMLSVDEFGFDRLIFDRLVCSHPDSRFSKVVKRYDNCWIKIEGRINTSKLSLKTAYVASLIFKPAGSYFQDARSPNQKARISLGGHTVVSLVRFLPQEREVDQFAVQLPEKREDGWMQLCLGMFFNEGIYGDVSVSINGCLPPLFDGYFFFEGIEFRPVNTSTMITLGMPI